MVLDHGSPPSWPDVMAYAHALVPLYVATTAARVAVDQ